MTKEKEGGLLVRSKDTDGIPGFHSGGDWTKGTGVINDSKEAFSAWNSKDKDWVDVSLKTATATLGVAAAAFDPLAAIMSIGVGWVIEHCKPFTAILDQVAGDPDDLNAFASTWKNVGKHLDQHEKAYQDAVNRELPSWKDPAGAAYRNNNAKAIVSTLGTLAEGAKAVASMGETLAKLVDEAHNTVRDLVADGVSQIISKALKAWATGGLSVAVDGPGIAAIVSKWVARIKNFLRQVILICDRIKQSCRRAAEAVDSLANIVKQLTRAHSFAH